MIMKLKVKKVRPEAIVPQYAHYNDAGFDLHSCIDCSLEQGQRMLIPTGLAFEVPDSYVGLIWPRSGFSAKQGIDVLGGVLDSGFRGEVMIVLLNTGFDDVVIKKGDRVAQMLIQPLVNVEFEEVKEQSNSLRGEKGLGSTGVSTTFE